MNMKLLAIVTPPSIYHGCSTRKTFWEGKFTLNEFTPVNIKNCGRPNVKNHIDIKDSDEYITLEILLKFGSMDNMIIKSLEQKVYYGRPGKGLITSRCLKTFEGQRKTKR